MQMKHKKTTTSGSLLHAREVEVVTCGRNVKKNTFRLALRAREVEVVTRCRKREKKTTSGSLLRAREVVNMKKNTVNLVSAAS